MNIISRRLFLGGSAALLIPTSLRAAGLPVFYRDPGCGCCHAWTERMATAGMPVELRDTDDLRAAHESHGIPGDLRGCHVGEIEGYAISGHVPPADIARLLKERPNAKGLSVPGMPTGSPGMEYENQLDPYEVILFGTDGSRSVYAKYG
jgi:hypothetical protein